MNDFKSRINRFMLGRRGIDEFEKFIGIAVLVFLALYIWLHSALCYYIVIIGIVYGLFRMFSTNIPKRYRENEKYLEIKNSFIKPKKKQNDSGSCNNETYSSDSSIEETSSNDSRFFFIAPPFLMVFHPFHIRLSDDH